MDNVTLLSSSKDHFAFSLEHFILISSKGISWVMTIALSGRWFEQVHAKYVRCTSAKCQLIREDGCFKFHDQILFPALTQKILISSSSK